MIRLRAERYLTKTQRKNQKLQVRGRVLPDIEVHDYMVLYRIIIKSSFSHTITWSVKVLISLKAIT